MLLVPKQLRRTGMTGDVPYYGGRLTPAQAYAASHPSQRMPASVVSDQRQTFQALQHLLEARVITPDEYQALLARVTG